MKKRKLLSLLLVLAMMLTLLPAPAAFAEGKDGDTAPVEDTNPADPAENGETDDPVEQPEETPEETSDAPAENTETSENTEARDTSGDEFYKILHLDCGRKYFAKDWIIALINEMAAAGYNQLQLAFGNDGLRFLLDDMSFTANGTTYDHNTVVSKVEAGNKAQNSSNDSRWLTENEMDEIIAHANAKDIEIVPLLNLPGHANAILDIVDDAYNAAGSGNTLDVATNDSAVNFGYAIFTKYVDYFADKDCKFFSFGADEYANDASGTFSFSRLSSEEYAKFVSFINKLAAYIKEKGMTPRAFNDGLYYNGQSADIDTAIQCCYWSSGWNGYNVASASTISGKDHDMINTNGDYYYVLGKSDKFDSSYSYASNFSNGSFAGNSTISNPAGSMFCIWCDYPNAETEAQVAQKTRLVLRAMAARMNDDSISDLDTTVVPGGFNADGTINVVEKTEENETKTDEKTKVSVTAPGLTSITVSQLEAAPTIEGAAEVVAYDVTLTAADDQNYAGEATVMFPLPEGLDTERVKGFVVESSGAITKLDAVVSDSTVIVTVPHFSTVGILLEEQNEVTFTSDITLTVGGSETIEVDDIKYTDENVAGNLDTNIATVKVDGHDAGESSTTRKLSNTVDFGDSTGTNTGLISDENGNYLTVSDTGEIGWTSNINEATTTTTTTTTTWYGRDVYIASIQANGYYLHVDNGTLKSSNSQTSSNVWRCGSNDEIYWKTVSITSDSYYLNYSDSSWSVSKNTRSRAYLYSYTDEIKPATSAYTEITFTGVSAGNTSVIVGNTQYNINVVTEDLTNVPSQMLEHWITNDHVVPTANSSDGWQKSIGATEAYGESGVAVKDLAFAIGYRANTNDETAFWKAVVNASDSKQTTDSSVDRTSTGTALTHVRYYNEKWSYKMPSGEWKDFQTNDQLVAYYVQKQNVTAEIKSYFKDWGHTPDKVPSGSNSGYVGLTVAVVYPDGTISPAESDMLRTSTTIFNYWNNRDIGVVLPKNNSEYTISKITVTDGSKTSFENWNGTIDWEKKTLEDGVTRWFDETTVWEKDGEGYSDEPIVDATDKTNNKLIWSAKNKAKLILIYLEVEEKETNLNVVWYDSTANTQIASMQVAMAYTTGQDVPTYTTALKDNNDNIIGSTTDWPGTTTNAENYLPDNAYVTNASNTKQTFNKNLVTNQAVTNAEYKTGLYVYDGAKISDDGKTLTLYYVLDSGKLNKSYVIDFGLKVSIPLSDLVENATDVSNVTITTPSNGKAEYNSTSKTIDYQPDETLDSMVTLNCTVTVGNNSNVFSIGILPASNVLYEENFFTTTENSGWKKDTGSSAHTTAQEAQKTGDDGTYNVFGYDNVYSTLTGAQGTYKAENLNTTTKTAALSTTFYGNGFDLIGTSSPTSGMVLLAFTKEGATTPFMSVSVDTRHSNKTLYQVPLAHVEFKDEETYKVDVYAYAPKELAVNATADEIADATTYSVEIDSFRVYRKSDNTAYPDAEQNVTYQNIISVMGNTVINAYVDKDNNTVTAEASKYEAEAGPQNEIYLGENQAIAFKVTKNSSAYTDDIQVSLRAVGSEAAGSYASNTEMYYKLTPDTDGVVTIKNESTNLLAIGNVKLPDGVKAEGCTEANEPQLLAAVRMAFASALYDPITNVSVKSVNALRNKLVTLTVTTDTDVKTLTVNGKTLRPTNALAVKRGWSSEYIYVYADTVRKGETKDYTITATNDDGLTATQTVQG